MKKSIFISVIAIMCLTSCSTVRRIIPSAVNTINTASLDVLNLERNDYEILNTITAESSINFRQYTNGYEIESPDDNFTVKYNYDRTGVTYKFKGILRIGYLSGDASSVTKDLSPEDVARGLAIYRAINIAKQEGADAVIAPTISTNVEQTDRNNVVFKSTVTAKIVKIKTDN